VYFRVTKLQPNLLKISVTSYMTSVNRNVYNITFFFLTRKCLVYICLIWTLLDCCWKWEESLQSYIFLYLYVPWSILSRHTAAISYSDKFCDHSQFCFNMMMMMMKNGWNFSYGTTVTIFGRPLSVMPSEWGLLKLSDTERSLKFNNPFLPTRAIWSSHLTSLQFFFISTG